MRKRHGKRGYHRSSGVSLSNKKVAMDDERKTMTIKQKLILMGIAFGVIALDVVIIALSRHPHDAWSYLYLIMITALGSYAIGVLEYKWKREKEMAHIIANRLMGNQHISSNFLQQAVHNSMSFGQQQLNRHQANINSLSALGNGHSYGVRKH